MSTQASDTRLTAVILAGDDAAELSATLLSVREAAEELLVIDTGGFPSAAKIAQESGAKIVRHAWSDDFAAARNAGLAVAKSKWVLCVDAGERLPQEQIGVLRTVMALDHDRRQAYLVYTQLPPATSEGAVERVARLRLLPNLPGVRFAGRVRRTPGPSMAALGLSPQVCSVTLQRGPREHDPQFKRQRARRDLRLLDLEIPQKGQQPRLLNALAECHATLENPQAAQQYYRLALRHAERGSTDMLEAYYGLLTSIDNARHEERMQTCLEALDVFPFDAQLLCAMGNYLQVCGKVGLAARAYQTAVEFGQVNPETWHLADVAEVAALCLHTLWNLQGEDEKCRKMLKETLERLPDSVRLRRRLIDLDVRYGRVLEALGQVEKLPKAIPHREAYRTAIRGACQAARKNWKAALGYLESAFDSGCREPLCLRWLATALVAENRREEASQIVQEWQRIDPASGEARKLLRELTAVSLAAGSRPLPINLPQPATTGLLAAESVQS